MIKKIKRMSRSIPDGLLFAALIIALASVATSFLVFLGAIYTGNQYKYNCNLDHRPDWHTVLLINGETYAYDPKYFCSQIKEKVVNG